jgi:glycosyltransferase involved in cell wall biosynthesis
MRVHVVMPVLNGARFIESAIKSILDQTSTDWRLEIFDAGSIDGSLEIAERFSVFDSRICTIRSSDSGIYDALRTGFDNATGDICCWLNSDDMLTNWAFSEVSEHFSHSDSRWVTGLPALWNASDNMVSVFPRTLYKQSWISRGFYHDRFLGCIQQESTFFHRSLWFDLDGAEKDTFADLKLAGDFYLWTRFALRSRLDSVPTVLGGFRSHQLNLSKVREDQYYAEVKDCNGTFLPKTIARNTRKLVDYFSAISCLKRARLAADQLNQSASV